MKKLLLLLTIALFSINAFSQNISIDVQIDKFSRDTTILSSKIDLARNGYAMFSIFPKGVPILFVGIYSGKKIMKESGYIKFLDENSNVYQFDVVKSDYSNVFGFVGDFRQLIGKKITEYRIFTGNDVLDFDISQTEQLVLSEAIRLCFEYYSGFSELSLQISSSFGKCTWYEAKEICKKLTQGGYNDWYLPSKFELELILKLNPNLKQELTNNWHWTSSEKDNKEAYNISSGGWISGEKKTNNSPNCMCVRKIK